MVSPQESHVEDARQHGGGGTAESGRLSNSIAVASATGFMLQYVGLRPPKMGLGKAPTQLAK